jgi:hypothetical protein
MEQVTQPTPQISSDSLGESQDYTLLWLTLGIIAIYWYAQTNKKNKEDFFNATYDSDSKVIDSFSKFIQTPLGSRYESMFLRQGVKPNVNQILRIDRCLQRLSKYEHNILKKATQFETRTDIERALSQKELSIYLPIRKKLMECMDSILHK